MVFAFVIRIFKHLYDYIRGSRRQEHGQDHAETLQDTPMVPLGGARAIQFRLSTADAMNDLIVWLQAETAFRRIESTEFIRNSDATMATITFFSERDMVMLYHSFQKSDLSAIIPSQCGWLGFPNASTCNLAFSATAIPTAP